MDKYSNSIDLFGDGIGKVEYVQHMGDCKTVVNAARVSFGKEIDKIRSKDEKLINYLIKHKHTSTLEHCQITFRLKVPLYIRSQHHRHRTWSYNEISRRYTEFDLEFYEPTLFRAQHKTNRQASTNIEQDPMVTIYDKEVGSYVSDKASVLLKEHHEKSLDLFNSMLQSGVCKEQARGVLPQNLYTEYYASCNLNNLFKFIGLRIHEGAQWEIQQVARAMLEIAKDLYPITTRAYINNLDDEELKSEFQN